MREGDGPVTVLGLFLAVWAFSLALFAIPWVRYDHTSFSTWLVIYGSLVMFSLGSVLARRKLRGHNFEASTSSRDLDPARLRLVWLGATAIGLLGLAAYIRAVDSVIGWHAILHDPQAVLDVQSKSQHFKSSTSSFTLLLYFNYVAVILWTIGLRTRAFSGKWRLARVAGALPVLVLLLPGSRQLLFILVIWVAAFHVLWRPPSDIRRLLYRLALGIMILLAFFIAVGSLTGSTLRSHSEIKRALTTQTASVLAIPYVYMTANEPLLSKLAADPIRPHTHGQMTILPLVKLAHVAGFASVPPEETAAFYPIPFDSYNSSTWLGPFLLDFGLVGCLILPLLFGFLFTTIGMRAVRGRSLVSLWLASLALYVVAFTPLNNELTIAPTWELALLGPLVVGLCAAGPGPRQRARAAISRVWPARLRTRLGLALLAGLCLLALVLGRVGVLKPQSPVLGNELLSDSALLGLAQTSEGMSDSFVLASRLQAAHPAFTYVASPQSGVSPEEPNVIGVYAGDDKVTLTAHAGKGTVFRLNWPSAHAGRELLANSDFTQPLSGTWSSSSSGTATIIRRREHRGYSVELKGSGHRAPVSTTLTQTFVMLPSRKRGVAYALSMRAQRLKLSRRMALELKAIYVDGTYEFVYAAIPAGNDKRMHDYKAVLSAKKKLFGLTAFVLDTGLTAFRGGLRIGHAQLRTVAPLPQ
jgi:oligosaccharide repeat unit polymerase